MHFQVRYTTRAKNDCFKKQAKMYGSGAIFQIVIRDDTQNTWYMIYIH